ncbi:hypothetical protein DM01DRAFT_1319407 [Hesseltinella vesiculosa]|uniref:C2 DOCK-type domain-containing protein n=1 Tax=Hesseltinella vesiculosa TaxID=101127 RepID=A0A1X2GMM1_9FUNG|nr:hypothetical protein DM01DRAFT_1319407 [Hesseltinella vesiculosa]
MAADKWVPLPKIAHGLAISPFTPAQDVLNTVPSSPMSRPTTIYSTLQLETASSLSNRLSSGSDITNFDKSLAIPLEVGDELYIFEKNGAWYRGYVLGSLEKGCKNFTAPNGIFPCSHVQIKEYVDMDAWDEGSLLFATAYHQRFFTSITQPLSPTTSRPIATSPSLASSMDTLAKSPSDSRIHDRATFLDEDHLDGPRLSTSLASDSQSQTSVDYPHHQHRPPPPLPMSRFDQSTTTGQEEPLVDEIGACVSEWNCLLYSYLEQGRYAAFNTVRDHINYLFQTRRQLLDQALSREELSRLRKSIIEQMVAMNLSQHRHMIIRHPERGFILDIKTTSVATLYYLHWKYTISQQGTLSHHTALLSDVESSTPASPDLRLKQVSSISTMSSFASSQSQTDDPKSATHDGISPKEHGDAARSSYRYKGGKFHQLFLDLKACVAHICQPGEWTELQFSLYSSTQGKFVSESFVVHLNYHGMPKDEQQIGRLQTLFVDLSTHDLTDQVYIVCYIYRLGAMKYNDKDHHLGASLFSSHSSSSGLSGGGYFDNSNRSASNLLQQTKRPLAAPLSSLAHTNLFRRPFGCAVLSISHHLKTVDSSSLQPSSTNGTPSFDSTSTSRDQHPSPLSLSPSADTHHATGSSRSEPIASGHGNTHYHLPSAEYEMKIHTPTSESTFYRLHEDIIHSNSKDIGQSARAESLCVFLRMFYGVQDQVLNVNAALLQDIPHTLRIGFPDVVFPDDVRNEWYLTLDSGQFAHFARNRNNIQVILCIRDNQTGEVVEDALSTGSGTPNMSTWESAVFYHDDKPVWNERVKVQMDDVQLWQRSHVFLVVKHRSRQGGGASSMPSSGMDSPASGHPSSSATSTSSMSHAAAAFARMTVEGNTSSSDKILAMGYIPLFIPPLSYDIVADGNHTLSLYKYDRHLLHPSNYFGIVPWCTQSTTPSNLNGQEAMISAVNQLARARFGNNLYNGGVNTSHTSVRSNVASTNKSTPFSMFSSSNTTSAAPATVSAGSPSSSASPPPQLASVMPASPHHRLQQQPQGRLHSVKDSLVISTLLCSTLFTQNATLVQLINWRSMVYPSGSTSPENLDNLLTMLNKFTFVGEMEVVKFLADIFDALLDILIFRIPDDLAKQDQLHDQAIHAITWVLSIVQDRRFSNFRPVLDVYIEQRYFANYHQNMLVDDSASVSTLEGNDTPDLHDPDKPSNVNQWNQLHLHGDDGQMQDMDKKTSWSYRRDAGATNASQLYTSYRYRVKHSPALQQYIKPDDTTYYQLLKGLIRLYSSPSNPLTAKRVRSCIKVSEYLFRFIQRSRLLKESFDRHHPRRDEWEQEYKTDLLQVFALMTKMMAADQPNTLIGTQTLVLQHFNEAITQVKDSFEPTELVKLIQDLMETSAHVTGKLVGFRLHLILQLVKSPIFNDDTCDCGLAKLVVQRWVNVWINSYMVVARNVIFAGRPVSVSSTNDDDDNTHIPDARRQTRLPRNQWIENLRLTLTILHEMLVKARRAQGWALLGMTGWSSTPASSSATKTDSPSHDQQGAGTLPTNDSQPTEDTSRKQTNGDALHHLDSDDDEAFSTPPPPPVTTSSAAIPSHGLASVVKLLIPLLPYLVNTYKDLQRLVNQAIKAADSSSTHSGLHPLAQSGVSSPMSQPLPQSSSSQQRTSRNSLTIFRERTNSIMGISNTLPTSSSHADLTDTYALSLSPTNQTYGAPTTGSTSTSDKSSTPTVVQALSTSPVTPFAATFPLQHNRASYAEAARMAGPNLSAMVTSGLLDLTVVLLDLFHLTPTRYWLSYLQSMAAKDGANATAQFLVEFAYVCGAILFGDDLQRASDVRGDPDKYMALMEEDGRGRRTWPKDWLNLDVVAHKIILLQMMLPLTSLLDMDAFAPDPRVPETLSTAGGPSTQKEQDIKVQLWYMTFLLFLRILGSPSLNVETALPQSQRAIWKLVGNIRGDQALAELKHLWQMTGHEWQPRQKRPSSYFASRPRSNVDVDDDLSEDGKVMKPDLLEYFADPSNGTSGKPFSNHSDQEAMEMVDAEEPEEEHNAKSSIVSDSNLIHVESMPILIKLLCATSFTMHGKLRVTTLGMMADLLIVHMRKTGDLTYGQNLLIGTIDKLILSDRNANAEVCIQWVAELDIILRDRLDTKQDRAWSHRVMESLSNLMELLVQLNHLPKDNPEFRDEEIYTTLSLLKFMQVMQRRDIYIKYVHKLVALHVNGGSFVEAALTLRFHANLYEWDPQQELDAIPELEFAQESAFTRKQRLYDTMIDYLDRGSAWELCVDLCKELAAQFETTVVDYIGCSRVLKRQATLVENICKKERYYNEYFRVAYYGRGFPASLRGQQFIYRGQAWEKMASFVDRIQNRHPSAKLLSNIKSAYLTDDQLFELDSTPDGQFLLVTAVTPVVDVEGNPLVTNPLTSMRIKDYFKYNNVGQFTVTQLAQRPDDELLDAKSLQDSEKRSLAPSEEAQSTEGQVKEENTNDVEFPGLDDHEPLGISDPKSEWSKLEKEVLNLWVEKLTYTTEDTFPTISLRSKITAITLEELSPIQNAIHAMEKKTSELTDLEKAGSAHICSPETFNLNPFSMTLNGAVDAPVNGGVALYRQTFLSPRYAVSHPDNALLIADLRKAIDDQVVVIDECLYVHSQLVSGQMEPFHHNLVDLFHKNFAEEIGRLKSQKVPFKTLAGGSIHGSFTNMLMPSESNLSTTSSNANSLNIRRGSLLDKPLMIKTKTSAMIQHRSNSHFSITPVPEEPGMFGHRQRTRSNDPLSPTSFSQPASMAGTPTLSPVTSPGLSPMDNFAGSPGFSRTFKMSIRRAARKAGPSSTSPK